MRCHLYEMFIIIWSYGTKNSSCVLDGTMLEQRQDSAKEKFHMGPPILICEFSTYNLTESLLLNLELVFLCIQTLPALYDQYEDEVDYLAGRGSRKLKKVYRKFDSKVLDKIPRGPVKEKKSKWTKC